jgi:hypothetical protein
MRRLLVVLAAASLLGALLIAPSAASPTNAHVYSPKAHPFGATYGEWEARWFTWFIEVPAPVNPAFDETGELCDTNQSGPVWMLSAAFRPGVTTRACTIPTGMGILLPGIGNECSNVEPPPFFGATEEELRACATAGYEAFFGDATQSITVDGAAVANLDAYRNLTPLYTYTLPPDNVYGLPPSEALAVSDAAVLVIKPLPPGAHQIVATINAPALGGVTQLIYNLTVVPRGHLH